MSYPESVEIDDTEYNINTDYKYALACFACINDGDISDTERVYGILGLLYKEEIPLEHSKKALELAIKYLQCGEEQKPRTSKADIDFEQDEHYIKSSFMSDYKIDLDSVELHWWKFCEYMQGLSSDCILNRIRDIRNYDVSTIKDAKQKAKINQAKRQVAIKEKVCEEDKKIYDDFYSQLK